jgi:hypothetical protein
MSRSLTVYEACTGGLRCEYVVHGGEPYVNGLVKLRGLWAALAINEGAVMFVGKGRRRNKTFVRVTWLADVESDACRKGRLLEFGRRLLSLQTAVEGSPSGETEIDFGGPP